MYSAIYLKSYTLSSLLLDVQILIEFIDKIQSLHRLILLKRPLLEMEDQKLDLAKYQTILIKITPKKILKKSRICCK